MAPDLQHHTQCHSRAGGKSRGSASRGVVHEYEFYLNRVSGMDGYTFVHQKALMNMDFEHLFHSYFFIQVLDSDDHISGSDKHHLCTPVG